MRLYGSIWLLLLLSFVSTLSAKSNSITNSEFRYSYTPKNIYINQLFGVTVRFTDKSSSIDMPKFEFDKYSDTQPISKEPVVVKNGDDSFYTFYFKARDYDVKIPELFIWYRDTQTSLKSKTIPIIKMEQRDDYCGVIAVDMNIKTYQISYFDESNHIALLSIEATEANLENMKITPSKEYNVESIKRKDAIVKAEFYVVLPVSQESLKFSYFNSIKRSFVSFELPIEITDTSVSTQSELNPKDDKFEKLKRFLVIFFVIFFTVMFLIKRDFLYLIFAVVSTITLLTFYIPHKKICIKQGSSLYILPTNTSTITTKLDIQIDRPILGYRGDFKKIEYKKGVIGWIKNEDICNH